MRIIGLANHKGGVAKTTTAVNLAASIAAMGRSVLLIDCDPQASASRWLGLAPAPGRPFLEDVFSGDATLAESTYPTNVERLSLVPSSSQLAVQDRLLAGKPAPAAVLLRALRAVPAGAFDYAFLDSPPQLGMLACNVLAASQELLIPLSPDPLSAAVLDELFESVHTIREWVNPELRILGILLVRVRHRTLLAREISAALTTRYAELILPVQVRETVRAAEAPARHLPLAAHCPESSAAKDYHRLAEFLLQREPPRPRASPPAPADAPPFEAPAPHTAP
jgi:chromosome partitioning protein